MTQVNVNQSQATLNSISVWNPALEIDLLPYQNLAPTDHQNQEKQQTLMQLSKEHQHDLFHGAHRKRDEPHCKVGFIEMGYHMRVS